MRRLTAFLLVTFLVTFCAFSQDSDENLEKLSFLNSSWTTVIPGDIMSKPALTSYGFCVTTDGRLLSAYSNKGSLLWETSTEGSRNVNVYSLPNDFILLWDSKKSTIKFLNPTGTLLWEKELTYNLTKAPYPGRDGRFFLTGDNIIECYGINGVLKWSLVTKAQKNIPIQELPDGSLVIFLSESDGKTLALRISPFGKAIEEITFAGEVQSASSTKDGIFLVFTNGAAGLFSITDGMAKNKWGLEKTNPSAFMLSHDNYNFYIEPSSDKLTVNLLSMNDGSIENTFEIGPINANDLKVVSFKNGTLFFADSKRGFLYDTSGREIWTALMPDNEGSTTWNQAILTNDNHLVFFMDNWTINGYLTRQSFKNNKTKALKGYKKYYDIEIETPRNGKISRNIVNKKRYSEIKKGSYGNDELKYASDTYSICASYLYSLTVLEGGKPITTVFDLDPYGIESIFKQLPLFATSDSASYLARLITNTPNESYLKVLLESVTKCGYDPDGSILKAIESRVTRNKTKNTELLKASCDAVYEICVFMGRPAFYEKGKDIIKTFLQPHYDYSLQIYAKQTFEKLIDLDL